MNDSDFYINMGTLMGYRGDGGDVMIPKGVTSIGSLAFRRCGALTSVVIPESVKEIGMGAFSDCSSLTSVTIPEGVTNIGEAAFSNCSSLTDITIPESVTSLSDGVFHGCKRLADANGLVIIKGILYYCNPDKEDVTIPNSVTSIGFGAFNGCRFLKKVTIPDSVTNIGTRAFSDCIALTSIEIPDGVTSIGDGAFSGCVSLVNVSIPDNVTNLGKDLFLNCKQIADTSGFVIHNGTLLCCKPNQESVIIPEEVTSIGAGAFKNYASLKSVTIPEWVTNIGEEAFSGCSSLTSVTILEGVINIGKKAFSGCSSLTSITVPISVKDIGNDAFSKCISLTKLTILNPEANGISPFAGCSNIKWVICPFELTQHINGLLRFSSSKYTIIVQGEKANYIAYSELYDKNNVDEFVKPGRWHEYDLELLNKNPVYKYTFASRLMGALGRLLNPVELTEKNEKSYEAFLKGNAKKLVSFAEEIGDAGIIKSLFALNILEKKADASIKQLLKESEMPELRAMAD